jgi:hypothetical protein
MVFLELLAYAVLSVVLSLIAAKIDRYLQNRKKGKEPNPQK